MSQSHCLSLGLVISDRVRREAPGKIYFRIQGLIGSGVPIEGEAGVGYVMRAGYDLPPLMFNREEIVALVAGGLTGMLSAYFTPVAYIPNHSVSFLCIEPVPEALVHSLSVAAMSDREVITALREAKQIAKPMKIDRYMRRLIDAVKANPGVRKAFQMTEKP